MTAAGVGRQCGVWTQSGPHVGRRQGSSWLACRVHPWHAWGTTRKGSRGMRHAARACLRVRQRQRPQAQVRGGVGDGAQHKLDGVNHLQARGWGLGESVCGGWAGGEAGGRGGRPAGALHPAARDERGSKGSSARSPWSPIAGAAPLRPCPLPHGPCLVHHDLAKLKLLLVAAVPAGRGAVAAVARHRRLARYALLVCGGWPQPNALVGTGRGCASRAGPCRPAC